MVVLAPTLVANMGWLLVMRGLGARHEVAVPNAPAAAAFRLAADLRPGWARPLVGLSLTGTADSAELLREAAAGDAGFDAGAVLASRASAAQGDTTRADALLLA